MEGRFGRGREPPSPTSYAIRLRAKNNKIDRVWQSRLPLRIRNFLINRLTTDAQKLAQQISSMPKGEEMRQSLMDDAESRIAVGALHGNDELIANGRRMINFFN